MTTAHETLSLTLKRENPLTGARRWWVTDPQQAAIILAWVGHDTSRIRNYHAHTSGGFGFTTGFGYNVFDADLLGGTGSGAFEQAFTDATGIYCR